MFWAEYFRSLNTITGIYLTALKQNTNRYIKGSVVKLVKRMSIILLVTLACVGCDQGTKLLASHYLPKSEVFSYLSDTVRIVYVENTGAFLGMGSALSEEMRFILFIAMAGLLLSGLFVYLAVNSDLNAMAVFGCSLIFSGGASNLYDRITNDGAVIDFLNVGVGMVRTGVFNIADMAIMLGGLLFMLSHTKLAAKE